MNSAAKWVIPTACIAFLFLVLAMVLAPWFGKAVPDANAKLTDNLLSFLGGVLATTGTIAAANALRKVDDTTSNESKSE